MQRGARAVIRLAAWPMAVRATAVMAILSAAGCATTDLKAVKAYGAAAAREPDYAAAASAYRESAVALAPYLGASAPAAATPAARGRQVRAAMQLHATLSTYFATLAVLAGADDSALDRQIDRIAVGVSALSTSDDLRRADAAAAADLLQVLIRAVRLPAQARSVHRLVDEGGPAAMAVLARLREELALWGAQLAQDAAMVQAPLQLLAAAQDAPPLAALLARDRAAVLARDHAAAQRSIATADLALGRIAAGHADIAAHLGDLSGAALAEQLAAVIADLQTLHLLGLE